jgi:4-hydroxy-3-methylbut-2-en-1-yl diphosphate reductase
MHIEKAERTGFCFGVKRAIDILSQAAARHGSIVTLGAIVHNAQVTEKMARLGITVSASLEELHGDAVAIGSHGVTPATEAQMRSRFATVIDTTCPFVHHAQITAAELARHGFTVIVYGESEHVEVKGILGHAEGKGIAAMDTAFLNDIRPKPKKVGVISQTTQIPDRFLAFSTSTLASILGKDSQVRVIDTICHDMIDRQKAAIDLARTVDLMLVVGSRKSANTNHIVDLCSTVTSSRLIEDSRDLEIANIKKFARVGVSSGASTSDETVSEVIKRLEEISHLNP